MDTKEKIVRFLKGDIDLVDLVRDINDNPEDLLCILESFLTNDIGLIDKDDTYKKVSLYYNNQNQGSQIQWLLCSIIMLCDGEFKDEELKLRCNAISDRK